MRKIFVTEDLFKPLTEEENFRLLNKHIPDGRFLEGAQRTETNLGKLIYALALEYYRIQVLTKKYSEELDVRKTVELITDWEKSVGLPVGNLTTTNKSLEERRKLVEGFLGNFGGVQTAQDFVDVAAFFGINCTVRPAIQHSTFPLVFPIVFMGSRKEATHTIIVETDEDIQQSFFGGDDFVFPIPFTISISSFLQDLFNLLAPANVRVYIKFYSDLFQ